MTIYVVTYWDYDSKEPVVTVFDNKVAAESFLEYAQERHDGACVDECPVYSEFLQDMYCISGGF